MDIISLIDWIPGTIKTYRPNFFTPAKSSRTIKYKQKQPPYRIAFVNGYVGNNWRRQSIQSAKAWVNRTENKKYIKEFKVVSVGDRNNKLISVIGNYINEGFDAIIFIAVNNIPLFFKEVFDKREQKKAILIAFDNLLNTNELLQINEDQFEIGAIKAKAVLDELGGKAKKILMVNGLAGNSVDLDNRLGMFSVLEKIEKLKIKQVWGRWDVKRCRTEVTNILRKGEIFDGFVCQQGSTGVIEAILDRDHPKVPMGVDSENKTRMLMAKHKIPGISVSQAPAMSAVALEASLALLQGYRLPRKIFLPIPQVKSEDLVDGVNYFTHLQDIDFDTGLGYANGFEAFTVDELEKQSHDDML